MFFFAPQNYLNAIFYSAQSFSYSLKIMYTFCKKPFKIILESQMYKDKPTPLFATIMWKT